MVRVGPEDIHTVVMLRDDDAFILRKLNAGINTNLYFILHFFAGNRHVCELEFYKCKLKLGIWYPHSDDHQRNLHWILLLQIWLWRFIVICCGGLCVPCHSPSDCHGPHQVPLFRWGAQAWQHKILRHCLLHSSVVNHLPFPVSYNL